MFFDGNVVRSGHLVLLSYMVPLSIISGHYDVISKKFKKLLISRFSVPECFFRNENVFIVISIKNTSK